MVNGVGEIEASFKYTKNKINENNLSHRIRYTVPRQVKINQLENVIVFDLETYNDQKIAERYEVGLCDVNRLRVRWDGDLTTDEIVTEKDVFVSDGTNENLARNMLKKIKEVRGR